MSGEVIKIQLRMAKRGEIPMMAANNQDRSFETEERVPAEILEKMGVDMLAYFKCRVRNSGKLKILKRVRDRHW